MRLSPEMGCDEATCLSFDIACLEFDERYRREAEATKEVPAPKHHGPAMTLKPLHDVTTLRRLLGLSSEDDARVETTPEIEAMAAEILRGDAVWLLP